MKKSNGKTNGKTNGGSEQGPFESPAAYLVRLLADQGFRPSERSSTFSVDFVKDYADDQGRVARASVQFERPTVASQELRLAGFSVLVQASIAPTIEAIEERAPPIMRGDLAAIATTFAGGLQAGAVDVRRCTACAAPVNEFFVLDGLVVCRECKK